MKGKRGVPESIIMGKEVRVKKGQMNLPILSIHVKKGVQKCLDLEG